MANPTQREQVFISYSHKDKKWLEMFQTSLKPFVRTNQIYVWDDTKIKAGDVWRDEIRRALASAKVAVLLVSRNFLACDFIAENELPPLLEAAQNEGLKILLVVVGHSLFEETEIGRYQAVNDPSRPLAGISAANREKEIVRICREIKAAAATQDKSQEIPNATPGGSQGPSFSKPGELSLYSSAVMAPPGVNKHYVNRALRAGAICPIIEELRQHVKALRAPVSISAPDSGPVPSLLVEIDYLQGEINGLGRLSERDLASQLLLKKTQMELDKLRNALGQRAKSIPADISNVSSVKSHTMEFEESIEHYNGVKGADDQKRIAEKSQIKRQMSRLAPRIKNTDVYFHRTDEGSRLAYSIILKLNPKRDALFRLVEVLRQSKHRFVWLSALDAIESYIDRFGLAKGARARLRAELEALLLNLIAKKSLAVRKRIDALISLL